MNWSPVAAVIKEANNHPTEGVSSYMGLGIGIIYLPHNNACYDLLRYTWRALLVKNNKLLLHPPPIQLTPHPCAPLNFLFIFPSSVMISSLRATVTPF